MTKILKEPLSIFKLNEILANILENWNISSSTYSKALRILFLSTWYWTKFTDFDLVIGYFHLFLTFELMLKLCCCWVAHLQYGLPPVDQILFFLKLKSFIIQLALWRTGFTHFLQIYSQAFLHLARYFFLFDWCRSQDTTYPFDLFLLHAPSNIFVHIFL